MACKHSEAEEALKQVRETSLAGDGGAPLYDGLDKSPWPAVVDHWTDKAKGLDVKSIEAAVAVVVGAIDDDKATCDSLGHDGGLDIEENKAMVMQAKVTVAYIKLVGLLVGTSAKDKVALRKEVLAHMAKLTDKDKEDPHTWQRQLPGALRQKIERAIKMRTL